MNVHYCGRNQIWDFHHLEGESFAMIDCLIGRFAHAAVAVDSLLYIFGGDSGDEKRLNDMWVLNSTDLDLNNTDWDVADAAMDDLVVISDDEEQLNESIKESNDVSYNVDIEKKKEESYIDDDDDLDISKKRKIETSKSVKKNKKRKLKKNVSKDVEDVEEASNIDQSMYHLLLNKVKEMEKNFEEKITELEKKNEELEKNNKELEKYCKGLERKYKVLKSRIKEYENNNNLFGQLGISDKKNKFTGKKKN